MKRILVLILMLVLLFPFAASCGKSEPDALVMFPYASRSISAKEGAVFTSADESVVTVDDSGLVLALAPGETTVTVKEGRDNTIYPVTVLDPGQYLKLHDCSSVTLKNSDILAKVEETKHALLVENATWSEIQTGAEEGDRVTMNYEGVMDGKTFEGGSATGAVLILGSGDFIDGFENGLLGRRTGDEIVLELTFPADYSTADLAGKPVTFTVKLTKVETPEYPEFNNEFVQKYAGYAHINEFDAQEYTNAKATLAIAEMVEKSELLSELPDALYDHYFDQYVLRLQTVLYYEYGTAVDGMEEVLELLDMTEEELRASAESQLDASVVQDCVFHSFAYQHGLLMTDEEFAEGTAMYIVENGYSDLDDLLTSSGLTLSDIREVVLIDYLGLKIADMVNVEK